MRVLRLWYILVVANDERGGMTEQTKARISAAEAARRLSVDPATITRWIARGHIKDYFRTPGGAVRIAVSEIERLSTNR